MPAVGRGCAARPGWRCGLRGAPAAGREATPCPARRCPALPSRPGGSRGGSYLWRSWGRLGGGGIPLPGPRLGAPLRASLSGRSEPRGAGAWLMAAAGTMRGGRCGGREERVTEREEGGRDGGRGPAPQATALSPPRPPPNPPPPGWRRRDRSPAAEPALREGAATGRGRPAPRGAAVALGGPRGRSRQRPGKGPPPTPPHLGAAPGPRLRPSAAPAGGRAAPQAAGHRGFTCACFGRALRVSRGAEVALLVALQRRSFRASCFLRKVSACRRASR